VAKKSKSQHTEENCIMKGRVNDLFTGFHDIASKLADNQEQMVRGMSKVEAKMESVSCLERRLDKKVDKIEDSVSANTKTLYKMIGGVGVLTTLIPLTLKFFF